MKPSKLSFESPYGCLWCGEQEFHHGSQWNRALSATHRWVKPNPATILDRMKRRRAARLSAEPTKYHATTGWAADHTGEEDIPFCADCKTNGCRRWMRIQYRLDRQRWQLSGMPHGTTTGDWDGDVPF